MARITTGDPSHVPIRRIVKSYRSKIRRHVERGTGFCLESVMGCTKNYLRDYIEERFAKGMSWENYGDWWFTNKEPTSDYNLQDLEQLMSYFHHTSFEPRWKEDVSGAWNRQSEDGLPIPRKRKAKDE